MNQLHVCSFLFIIWSPGRWWYGPKEGKWWYGPKEGRWRLNNNEIYISCWSFIMSLALGYVLFIHWSKVKSHVQAHSWSACSKDFTPPSLAPELAPFPGWLYCLCHCRCGCPANHAGLFEGQPLHMLTKHRTLSLEWYSWESGHCMKNRARKTPIPTKSSWNLPGSSLRVWLQKHQVLFSALPYAICVTLGSSLHPSPTPWPYRVVTRIMLGRVFSKLFNGL